MKRPGYWIIVPLCMAFAKSAQTQDDVSITVRPPQVSQEPAGKRIIQDVVLATSVADYTLRYDYVEKKDDPRRITWVKWAPTIGYTPLGIAGPSEALWYNQGFFIWTFDGFNIQDYKAEFRVVRSHGTDAMVEYVWDTPKVRAIARFAMTSGSDKLIFLGHYEPRDEIREVKLRLMCYPATFSKPWQRSATTTLRTLTSGSAELDLAREHWVLLEDTYPGRLGDGSAGLLLGDTSAFASVRIESIGGYAEYVDIMLKPGRRHFALGLYEFPSMPDPEETRAYFRRSADAESDALALLAGADSETPLKPLPVDAQRKAAIAARDEELMRRPAERFQPDPKPLEFSWAARLPGKPVKVALLCPRWRAYEAMELARRVAMQVEHLYFDSSDGLVVPDYWPYRAQTGIGPLSIGAARRHGLRICSDPATDVILVAGLHGEAIPEAMRAAILQQVKAGKGLMIAGDEAALSGWPKELTADRNDEMTQQVLESFPWRQITGLRDGESGRLGEGAPLAIYRYGQGRVAVFLVRTAPYSALVPRNDATEGLDGATDRILALNGAALLAAAGRQMPCRVVIGTFPQPLPAAKPTSVPLRLTGAGFDHMLVRVQDDHDEVVLLERQQVAEGRQAVSLPPLPAGRKYFVDVMLRDKGENCLGCASSVVEISPEHLIKAVRLSPSFRVHELAVPTVNLVRGGVLTCEADIAPHPVARRLILAWEVRDCFDRLLAVGQSAVGRDGKTRVELRMLPPVTVCHRLDTKLIEGDKTIAVRRDRFTIPVPYPYDDFTFLMWSYAGGEPVIRRENRLCYELGADMMDLCHMRGYTDAGAAREYELAARSGLRLVPYVTRIAMEDTERHELQPGLFNEEWIEKERQSIQVCCRQAAPYRPAAYTLGDENYLSRGKYEVGADPQTMTAFREWLRDKYGTIDALNAAWNTDFPSFEAIEKPMWIEEAAEQKQSFAAWFDHKDFLDSAFASLHEKMAGFVRKEDPVAKVGWDGLLGYHWGAGYNFYKLTRNLELNQVYTVNAPQGDFVRSFKRPDSLTGEWGNAVADNEEGFSAIAWHNLFEGHNSCWWWTSWGCDYIPFNPDLSLSNFGQWYFQAAREIKAGPGKLLLHAQREGSGIAILYSQADMFAARLASKVSPGAAFQPDGAWVSGHRALIGALADLGYQCRHVAAEELATNPSLLSRYRLLILPLATCLSDAHVAAIREFVRLGGTLLADGRVGLLTENGVIRSSRPLDEVFGVESPAGMGAFAQASKAARIQLGSHEMETQILEPNIKTANGRAKITVEGMPLFVTNSFGKGRAMLLNIPFAFLEQMRAEAGEEEVLEPLRELLLQAGLRPFAKLRSVDGAVRCVEQVLFTDGDLRYLCLEQDILQRGLPEQRVNVELPEKSVVYDMRAGKQIGNEPINSWETRLSRGKPQVFALLPYRVVGLDVQVPRKVKPGELLAVKVLVKAEQAAPQFHVVHMNVYAPNCASPHRQYSQNISCSAGRGQALIPFALNDPLGEWEIQFRDAATGVTTKTTVALTK